MAPKTFSDLSDDIKVLIINQVNRPTDLKNVCLASKLCHDVAVRSLYHTVSLDVGGPLDTRITAFLNPNNKGLKHIKRIRLYLARVRDTCNQEQQAQLVTRMILELLPEDVLEEFSWCPWSKFSADNLLLLYKKQKRMKWLEAMTLDKTSVLPELEAKPEEYAALFQNCKKLAFYPETRETLELCHSFLIKTPAVEEIIIHTNFEFSKPAIPARELNDTALQPGLITSSIFRHMLPFDTCTPLQNLKALRLHKVHLRHCAETYLRVVDFTRLTSLRVFQCTGTDALLSEMSRSTKLPQKLQILEIQHKDNPENDALTALDGLLCLVSGLQDLVIDMDNVKALPAAAGVVKHGKTLEMLNVHCFTSDESNTSQESEELVWSIDDFTNICKSAVNLEQLCCAFPVTRIMSNPSEEWMVFARAATNIKELVTINSTTWPTYKSSTNPVPRSIYEHLLQSLAQKLFEIATGSAATLPIRNTQLNLSTTDLTVLPTSTTHLSTLTISVPSSETTPQPQSIPSKLKLIAFGTSDKIFERQDSRTQSIFYRSKQITPEGKEVVHAASIGWCLRQYVEPRSDVLDFQLSRTVTMPVREWDSEDDSD